MKPILKLLNISKFQLRDATRLGIQSAFAAALTYSLLVFFDFDEVFVAVLSAVLVVEPSIGDTYNSAKGRIIATLLGSSIGFICSLIFTWGWPVILSLVISMLVINAISSLHPSWRYGVVAAVAISVSSDQDAFSTSIDRLIAIGIGVTIGIVVSFAIWPDKASNRVNRFLRRSLLATIKRFEIAFRNTRAEEKTDAYKARESFHSNISKAKSVVKFVQFGNKSKLSKQIDIVEKLYNSILIIHRVSDKKHEHITSGEAGIEKDADKVQKKINEILRKIIDGENVPNNLIDNLSELISSIKKSINQSEDNSESNILRFTFIFGLMEIESSINSLVKSVDSKE